VPVVVAVAAVMAVPVPVIAVMAVVMRLRMGVRPMTVLFVAHGGHLPAGDCGSALDFRGPSNHHVRMDARMHLSGAHDAQQPVDGERVAVAVDVLGLLADRTRLVLLRRLGDGEADVTTLTEAAGGATRTSVSQHLARLRLAGLVTTRKDGRRVVYALRHGHLRRLVDEALNVADHRLGHLPPHD